MQLYAVGLNHQSAPVSIRERLAFDLTTLGNALRDLLGGDSVKEAAILSTCNRTEVYAHTPEPQVIVDWLAGYHALRRDEVAPYIYLLPQSDAVKHAFRVASGLDSMVLGEPQILGQMKQAVKTAESAGTLGILLNKLFQRTFSVAKEVRSQTDIGAASISMAAAAVRLAGQIFPSVAEQAVLFIGAGEMIELAAAHFAAAHPKRIVVANRTLERGERLAARFNASAMTLKEVPDRLHEFDIVVTCTASTLPILGKGLLERACRERRHRPIVVVDLAVPRDVEPEAGKLNDVFLYSVDDLAAIVKEGLNVRQAAVIEAEAIIETQVRDFMHWVDSRAVVPTIRALQDQAEVARRAELDRVRRLLSQGTSAEEALEILSRALTNKHLHGPTHALNQASGAERGELIAAVQRIYQLPDTSKPTLREH